MARDGVVEAGEKAVDRPDGVSGMHEQARESSPRSHPVRRPRGFERANHGRPDRDDSVTALAGSIHQVRGGL